MLDSLSTRLQSIFDRLGGRGRLTEENIQEALREVRVALLEADVANRLFQQWRLGQKGLDNGVLLVVFAEDRKLSFEIGYGLEAVVPDAAAGQIIRQIVAPSFRERRYAAG